MGTLFPYHIGSLGCHSRKLAGKYTEQEKSFVLFTLVIVAAAQLLSMYEKEVKTFAQLTDILSKRYDKRDNPAVVLQKFKNFKQSSAMSVQKCLTSPHTCHSPP